MEVIATTNAPKALGPYSQAVLAGSILFVSGQIAINPETGEMVQSSIEAETQQVLDNIEAILTEARFRFMDVVKTVLCQVLGYSRFQLHRLCIIVLLI